PKEHQHRLCCEYHSLPTGGHFGSRKTISTMKHHYFWPFMVKQIKNYCRTCAVCAARSGQQKRPKPKLSPLPIAEEPMDRVGMDVLKLPMSVNGNNHVLVLQDYLTKYLFTYPLPNETAEEIGKLLVSQFFANFGLPRELLTDRGSAFISLLFHKLEELYKIKHLFTTSCHPQTDGMVERANKTIITALAKLLAEYGGEWEDLLGPFSLSYNITPHASTGVEPYLAMFGREGRRPSSLAFSQQCRGVTYS
ncbi:MAG: transposase family protein, partial [Gammaproteobacteria bacterium]|nr:transposase family protein [Gammaproteobacteria bacterium]